MNRDQALVALGGRKKRQVVLAAKRILELALRGMEPRSECAIDWVVDLATDETLRVAIPSLGLSSTISVADVVRNVGSERSLALVVYKKLFPQAFTEESIALARDRGGKDLLRPFARQEQLGAATVPTRFADHVFGQVRAFDDIAIIGFSSAGKSVAARQAVHALLQDGWQVTWLDFSSANPAPEQLINTLSVTPLGSQGRHLIVADDVQASPVEFGRVVGLCSILRTSERMTTKLIAIGWNSVRDLIASLLPSAVIVNSNGSEVLRELIDHKLSQQSETLAQDILHQSRGNVLLGNLAVDLSVQKGTAPRYEDLVDAAWQHSNIPSDLNAGHVQILYTLAALAIFETETRRSYLDSISHEGLVELLGAGAVRADNEFVSLGHIEFAKLILEKLKRHYSAVTKFEQPSELAVRYLRASDRIQIIKTLDRLDLARLADASDDKRGGAFLARAWSSIGLLARRVRNQNDSDPGWGDNIASCVFAGLALEAIGDDSWERNHQIIRRRWSIPSSGDLPLPVDSITAERLDFDEIKRRMADEDLQPIQRFQGYVKATKVDLDAWHRTWVASLLIWYESQSRKREPDKIRALVLSLTKACSPDGWFEPARVPWQTARCLLSLASAGLNFSTDELVRRACNWMRRAPPNGPCRFGVWESGTGDWNSTAMTTSMSVLALLRAGVPTEDKAIQLAASYLLSKKHEWSRPGCEIDCVLAVQALLAAKGGWRLCSAELEGLLRWSGDPQVWNFATRTAKEAQQESSKAAFIALELITIVWEIVRSELPLLLQNIAVVENTEHPNRPQDYDQAKIRLLRAATELQDSFTSHISERRLLLRDQGGTPSDGIDAIQEKLKKLVKGEAELHDLQKRLSTASSDEEIRDLIARINEIGRELLMHGWSDIK